MGSMGLKNDYGKIKTKDKLYLNPKITKFQTYAKC